MYDADPDRVRVVHPGVDLEVYTPGDVAAARAEVGIDAADLLLVFVGRVQPLKAPDLLIEAVADLCRRRPDLAPRLRVAILGGPSGSGLERPRWLEDLAAERGIADRVVFSPPTSRARLAQWYRAADLVAVPSYNESFGLVAVEAQACGTPVVAADVGGLPTAVGGGVLVPTHDIADWSRELERLLDDPAERSRLSDLARSHAASFGWGETANSLLAVYGEAMESRPRA